MVDFTIEAVDVRDIDGFYNYSNTVLVEPYVLAVMIDGVITFPKDENGVQLSFKTKEEAESFIDLNSFEMPNAWVVMKNSDFTEGRGPMVLDGAFFDFKKAHDFILDCIGIYGSPQYMRVVAGVNVKGKGYAYTSYNGYDIRPLYIK